MNRLHTIGLGLALAIGAQSGVLAASIPWQHSWQAARTLQQKNHRPIMMDFYTDW